MIAFFIFCIFYIVAAIVVYLIRDHYEIYEFEDLQYIFDQFRFERCVKSQIRKTDNVKIKLHITEICGTNRKTEDWEVISINKINEVHDFLDHNGMLVRNNYVLVNGELIDGEKHWKLHSRAIPLNIVKKYLEMEDLNDGLDLNIQRVFVKNPEFDVVEEKTIVIYLPHVIEKWISMLPMRKLEGYVNFKNKKGKVESAEGILRDLNKDWVYEGPIVFSMDDSELSLLSKHQFIENPEPCKQENFKASGKYPDLEDLIKKLLDAENAGKKIQNMSWETIHNVYISELTSILQQELNEEQQKKIRELLTAFLENVYDPEKEKHEMQVDATLSAMQQMLKIHGVKFKTIW